MEMCPDELPSRVMALSHPGSLPHAHIQNTISLLSHSLGTGTYLEASCINVRRCVSFISAAWLTSAAHSSESLMRAMVSIFNSCEGYRDFYSF